MSDPIKVFGDRLSNAPVCAHQVFTAAGVTAQELVPGADHFQYGRAILIIEEWVTNEDLEVLYAGDENYSTIPAAMVKTFAKSAILPFAISAFRSSGATETTFKIAILR